MVVRSMLLHKVKICRYIMFVGRPLSWREEEHTRNKLENQVHVYIILPGWNFGKLVVSHPLCVNTLVLTHWGQYVPQVWGWGSSKNFLFWPVHLNTTHWGQCLPQVWGWGKISKNFQKYLVSKVILKAQVTKSTRDVTTHLVFCHGQVQVNSMTGI